MPQVVVNFIGLQVAEKIGQNSLSAPGSLEVEGTRGDKEVPEFSFRPPKGSDDFQERSSES